MARALEGSTLARCDSYVDCLRSIRKHPGRRLTPPLYSASGRPSPCRLCLTLSKESKSTERYIHGPLAINDLLFVDIEPTEEEEDEANRIVIGYLTQVERKHDLYTVNSRYWVGLKKKRFKVTVTVDNK